MRFNWSLFGCSIAVGIISGGACATTCPPDAKEPNQTQTAASDLGELADNPNSSASVKALSSPDGDEDWFKVKVKDTGFGGNPTVTATVTVDSLEVAIFYVCD